jgi:hypothetical protein
MKSMGVALAFATAAALVMPLSAIAASYQILPVSQQQGPSRASTGASVEVSSRVPGAHGQSGAPASAPVSDSETSSGPAPPAIPTLPSNSPKLANPRPYGPNSFWYPTVEGQRCAYVPASNGICFNVVAPGGPAEPPAPPVNPAALAEGAASRLALGPGRIQVSPTAQTAGLTGAASWFWIEPAPAVRSLSVSLRGERVTVSASAASVRWSFGDSSELVAGPGVPYQAGSVPAAAVRHVYQTRCLPGDQGHDPYVLSSCGPNGYAVEAMVQWGISYTASGPVGGGGALPTRSTAASIAYPVGEARAFLTTAGGAG